MLHLSPVPFYIAMGYGAILPVVLMVLFQRSRCLLHSVKNLMLRGVLQLVQHTSFVSNFEN